MSIRVNCPGCKTPYVCSDEQRGKQLRCNKCQQVFQVPAATRAAAAETAIAEGSPSQRARVGARSSPPEPVRRSSGKGMACAVGLVCLLLGLCSGIGLGGTAVYYFFRAEPSLALNATTARISENHSSNAGPTVADTPRPVGSAREQPAGPQNPPNTPVAQPAEPEQVPVKAVAGKPFRYSLPLNNPTAQAELAAGPPGLTVRGRGEVFWVPPAEMVGKREFSVRITDGGQTSTRRYQLEVEEAPPAVVSAPPDQPRPTPRNPPASGPDAPLADRSTLPEKATVGQPFSYQFPNAGGTVKYDLLPQWKQRHKGMELSPEGLLTWTPPSGTPAARLDLMVNVGNQIRTYYLDLQDDPQAALAMPTPGGWVMLPDGVTLIVSDPAKAQIIYVDTVTMKETKRVSVDFKPGPLAFQGTNLFAAAQGSGMLYVLNLESGEVKKEIKASPAPLLALACHPEHGLIYGSSNDRHVVAIDPEKGTSQETRAQGVFLAMDPVKGDALYTGIQGQIRDVIEFREVGGGRFTMRSGTTGDRSLLLKYVIKGEELEPVGANDNAAVNGKVLRITPDGKKVGIPGGGGYRPPAGGVGGGAPAYSIALFSTDDVKSMVGTIECGAYPNNLAFHPVLDIGAAEQGGPESTLHFFNSKSLAETSTLSLAAGGVRTPGPGPRQGPPSDLFTFGSKGTKLLYHDPRGTPTLRAFPLQLTDKDREALEKAYGK